MPSTTWHKRRVDNIFLTRDYNKRKQNKIKNVIHDLQAVRNSVIQRIDFAINPSQMTPQWGAADAEIKVPSGENTELKCSPFKA